MIGRETIYRLESIKVSISLQMSNNLAKEQTQKIVTDVVRGEVADTAFKTVARVRARLEAYNKVSASFNTYIIDAADRLKNGLFGDSAFKELGTARLVAQWMVESERFFEEMEPMLNQTEKSMRRGFMEENFEQLDEATKNRLWDEFNDRKAELIVWMVEKVRAAIAKQRSEQSDR